ncbi:MAG: AbiV family abortive infection protein [Thaumarchaeota archaeon]|nr:AbiV family abortive infection protein [Nitrososphaerota archaeon]
MPTRSYPASEIDNGIKKCLARSQSILESASLLLNAGKKNEAYVLYTFAVEEFGKACLLKKMKNTAQQQSLTTITKDTVTFHDHDAKIKEAESTFKNPTSKIRVIDIAKVPEYNPNVEIEFKTVEGYATSGDFLGFDNRLDALYVDYKNNTWVEPNMPSNFEMESGFVAFRGDLEKWKNDYEQGII